LDRVVTTNLTPKLSFQRALSPIWPQEAKSVARRWARLLCIRGSSNPKYFQAHNIIKHKVFFLTKFLTAIQYYYGEHINHTDVFKAKRFLT
jgi:hypothetical protein